MGRRLIRRMRVEAATAGTWQAHKPRRVGLRPTGVKEMDRVRLANFRSMLQTRQQELARIVNVSQEHGRSVVEDYPQDAAERASIFVSKEFFFAHSTQERRLLQMVTDALERIEDGTYGQCLACEEKINDKRLEAVPWARFCLQCQERMEQLMAERRAA